MKVTQKHWAEGIGWQTLSGNGVNDQVQLVLVFGDNTVLRQESRLHEVGQFFPQGRIVGCSTAGEIIGNRGFNKSLTGKGAFF